MKRVAEKRDLSAREVVFRRISRQAKRFPDLDLSPIETGHLEARDAALAHAIYDAVVRRWLTLEGVLAAAALKRPFEELQERIRAALLVGAAQILFMERIPARAAVNESVEWVKTAVRPGAGGLVNAALRQVCQLALHGEAEEKQFRERWSDKRDELPLSDGRALVLTREALPVDPLERLAAATSHPVELLRTWARTISMREARRLALHGLAQPPVILNTLHARAPVVGNGEGAEAERFEIRPHMAPGHHVFLGSHAALTRLLRERDDVWAQDPASSLAVMSVTDLKPRVVVDVCAGRGTKTRQLAHTFPGAEIVATDIDAERHRALAEAFGGHERVRVVGFGELEEWNGKANLVLIDAPCSNTGVLARRVEARYRVSEEKTNELTAMQRQIMADALRLLHRGGGGNDRGMILYSTCSLDPRENERQVEWASRWHSLSASRVNTRAPSGGPGEPPEAYSDGAFAALLS